VLRLQKNIRIQDFILKIIDNISVLLGDELKSGTEAGAKIRVPASCFSIFAYEALKTELESIQELEFILTGPTFIPNEALGHSKTRLAVGRCLRGRVLSSDSH